MASVERERAQYADGLYEQYGKPLEAEHWGKFVSIAPDGRTVVGDTVTDVMRRAKAAFGPGSYLFKVGPRFVWKIR